MADIGDYEEIPQTKKNMSSISEHIAQVRGTLKEGVELVCVSKYQTEEAIMEAYEVGERDFGESHVQELCRKYKDLPKDIRWHMIGHLQTNKVKDIVPFIHLIQSVDSWHLLEKINTEAGKIARVVHVLLEVHVAREESKSGMTVEELQDVLPRLAELEWVQVDGLMTMATNTEEEAEIRRCFRTVQSLSLEFRGRLPRSAAYRLEAMVISMGMSDDYRIAVEEGSTMVRIGSGVFGERIKNEK